MRLVGGSAARAAVFFAASAGVVVAATGSAAGARQDPATVLVQVSDGNGQPVGGLQVTLEVHDATRLQQSLSGVTEDDGAVRFDSVPTGAGFHVRPLATYLGVTFSGTPTAIAAGDDAIVPLTVYDATREGDPLHIDIMHLILQVAEPGFSRVAQVMLVRNVGDKAYIGGPATADGRPSGLIVPVPEQAVGVTPLQPPEGGLDPGALELEPGRLLDLRPVPLEGRQVAITYEIVDRGSGQELSFEMPYPAQSVSIMVGGPAAGSVRVEAPGFASQGAQQIPDQGVYETWTSDVVEAGQRIELRLFDAASTRLAASTWALIGLGLALLLAIGGSLLRDARPALDPQARQALIERIATLDRQYEEGAISGAAYFTRRGTALEQLLALEPDALDAGAGDADSADDGAARAR